MNASLHFVCASQEDAVRLAELRVKSMRPSLEVAGRYDPHRARTRFLDGFDPSETFLVLSEGRLVGFYVLRERASALLLDHIYIAPEMQGVGFGQRILAHCDLRQL